MKLNTGAKVWLWIVFVLNIIAFAMAIIGVAALTAIAGPIVLVATILSLVAEVVLIVGVAMLLFSGKKIGFYLMVACAVAGLILNLIAGEAIARSIVSAVLCPLITYLLIKNQWNELA